MTTPPFFIFDETGELETFDTLSDVEEALEGVDVQAGCYQGFDSRGYAIELVAKGVKKGWFFVDIGRTCASVSETRSDQPTDATFRHLLTSQLRKSGQDIPASLSLEEAIRRYLANHK